MPGTLFLWSKDHILIPQHVWPQSARKERLKQPRGLKTREKGQEEEN